MTDEIKTETETSEETEETKSEETETKSEETDDSSKEKSEQDLANLNKQLYARTKKAEEDAKALRAELIEKSKKPKETSLTGNLSAEEVARLSTAFDGLSTKERERLIAETKVRGLEISSTNLGEIRQSEDYALWQKSWKEKVEKENTPPPSTKQSGLGSKVKLSELSPDERLAYLQEIGAISKWPKANIPPRG